jgi:hypothetical protein
MSMNLSDVRPSLLPWELRDTLFSRLPDMLTAKASAPVLASGPVGR